MEEPLRNRIQVNNDGQISKNIDGIDREAFILAAIAPSGKDVFRALPEKWQQRLERLRTIAQERPLTEKEQQELKGTISDIWKKSTEEER